MLTEKCQPPASKRIKSGRSERGQVFRLLPSHQISLDFFQRGGFCDTIISHGTVGIKWSRTVTVEGIPKSRD